MTGMDSQSVKEFFENKSGGWLSASYTGDGYAYPTAEYRTHRAIAILKERFPYNDSKLIDLGCGAGQLCSRWANLGNEATGVDQSMDMISRAIAEAASVGLEMGRNVKFVQADLLYNNLEGSQYDAVTCLGVIGYLSTDGSLFKEAIRLLKPDGLLVLSCRNRLFNMVSISDKTLDEIDSGAAGDLVKEILSLYKQIPESDVSQFVQALQVVSGSLIASGLTDKFVDELSSDETEDTDLQPRQHSPRELVEVASDYNFEHEGFYAVHPHLLMAGLNRFMPPGVFNALSEPLDLLCHHPSSLIWSSQFISVFRKL